MTDEQILSILQKDAFYVSGERISETLGLSRTAVWKAVNRLRAKGYVIESMTRRGYRFVQAADILDANELSPVCRTRMIGSRIVYSDSCTSTNDEAKAGGLRGDADGTVYITDRQTDGRGRMGRDWHSEEKKGIALSILLRPLISPTQIMSLSLLAGLCVCKAIEEATGLRCGVKWPNDVVAGRQKIAGILIEMSTAGEMVQFIVLGIGVNANNRLFPEAIRPVATSVLLKTGQPCSRRDLAARILEQFEAGYLQWIRDLEESAYRPAGDGAPSFINEYKARCVNLGKDVTIHESGRVYTGVAKDITPDGKLLVVLPDGGERFVLSGEVSVRGIYGYT